MTLTSLPVLSSTPKYSLALANGLLNLSQVKVRAQGRDRIPDHKPLIVVSNHRSMMDAPLLMSALDRPVRFACHHYMAQVPGLQQVITALGCLPLEAPGKSQMGFFRRAMTALSQNQAVGIFPEGTAPMVQKTAPENLYSFHRGFAQLALRAPVEDLVILPVAIASQQEISNALVPLKWLSWFDADEPFFQQPGWHPLVLYQQVEVLIGQPIRIDPRLRAYYQRQGAYTLVTELTQCCQEEIAILLKHSFSQGQTR